MNMCTVAIIDSTVRAGALPACTTFHNVAYPGNCQYHGDDTHGTAVARTITRIAPGCRLAPVSAANATGELTVTGIEHALEWLMKNRQQLGLRLICLPVATYRHHISDEQYRHTRICQYITSLRNNGVLTIAPAGNWHQDLGTLGPGMAWPAVIREVVSAGAMILTDKNVRIAPYSQRLPVQPDNECHTTLFTLPDEPGNTSGAAAVATGILASILCERPNLSPDALLEQLFMQCDRITEDGFEWSYISR